MSEFDRKSAGFTVKRALFHQKLSFLTFWACQKTYLMPISPFYGSFMVSSCWLRVFLKSLSLLLFRRFFLYSYCKLAISIVFLPIRAYFGQFKAFFDTLNSHRDGRKSLCVWPFILMWYHLEPFKDIKIAVENFFLPFSITKCRKNDEKVAKIEISGRLEVSMKTPWRSRRTWTLASGRFSDMLRTLEKTVFDEKESFLL